ncbi:unnamed protein product [Mortierella alpina]
MNTTSTHERRSDSKWLSRKLFFLAVYSLTGAALMGSSVGLVVYQNRQFFLLERVSRYGLSQSLTPHTRHRQHDSHPPASSHPGIPPPHRHHPAFGPLFFSSLLPICVWIISLLACSVLITSRKWVPKLFSPRAGILMSQCIFSLFWIFSGAIQEVQESLVLKSRALRGLDLIAEAMEDSSKYDETFRTSAKIRTMVVPLCTVWYLTVILLGLATGLLTTSSSILEQQLLHAYEIAQLDACAEQEEVKVLNHIPHDEKTRPTHVQQLRSTLRYTNGQRLVLGTVILFLLATQIKFFHWVVQSQSIEAHTAGTATSVSSYLTIVGLMTGTAMVALGARFLPRTLP